MVDETRELAAIVVVDTVQSSRLVRANESGMLAALNSVRADFIEPEIKSSRCRFVKGTGDGWLMTFASVVEAVRFAAKLQRANLLRNKGVPSDRQIVFRIGINLGDIILVGRGDIHGDSVNVAAHLEKISTPGGFCLAQAAHEQVVNKSSERFRDAGEVRLKNDSPSIHVWHWVDEDSTAQTPIPLDKKTVPKKSKRRSSKRFEPIDAGTLLARHREGFREVAKKSPFIVFLCGPTLSQSEPKPSAVLRSRLQSALEAEEFKVVLGEDDGLEEGRLELGMNAQDNELEFIAKNCNAVIVVADSVGSFCELGLFSWHFVHDDGVLSQTERRTDCIVLIDKQYEGARSYLNEGPGRAVNGFGLLSFVDFATYDMKSVISRVTDRRGTIIVDNKTGPRRKARK